MLEQFLKDQKEALIDEYKNRMSTCLMATPKAKLEEHAEEYGWSLFLLSGCKEQSAFVIQKSNDSIPEIWARWNYSGYRKAFRLFLQQFHHFPLVDLPMNWQVDHLQAKFRFQQDHPDYFCRLILVDRRINAAFGAGIERSFNKVERIKPPSGGFHIDWLTFVVKICGMHPPGKNQTPDEWRTWAKQATLELRPYHICEDEHLYDGLVMMLQLAFTGRYTGFHTKYRSDFATRFEPLLAAERYPTRHCTEEYLYELTSGKDGSKLAHCVDQKGVRIPLQKVNALPGEEFMWGYLGSGPKLLCRSLLHHHFGHGNFRHSQMEKLLGDLICLLPDFPEAGPYFLTTKLIDQLISD